MTKKPLHPLDIPDDTSNAGLAGWMFESITRSYALRLAGIIALLGATVAALSPDAPTAPRVATIVLGVAVTFALLISQLRSWRRSLQWLLIVGAALACGALLAIVVRPG
ncbi:hypothetical protein [Nocardioides sp. B-3]|uniref:hypothetical protein n=1 Tax=Nocardioides sp. B-3 TaxID=2895565 RepID=UPI0021528EB2|nr:hypothetical protein [Nocardioides sp. B-3]UUZ61522.1 hypothetical protein LP418_13755 [Nocardioides sp. B-3]